MVREALFEFENAALIEGGSRRTVDVALQNGVRRICKAEARIGSALGCAPILKGKAVGGKTICANAWLAAVDDACRWADGRARQQVGVERNREMCRVNIDVACGQGKSRS